MRASLGQLEALRLSYDSSKPWSPQRLFEFHQKLAAVQDGITGDIEAAIHEAQSRLATDLDRLAHQITSQVSLALQAITDSGSDLISKLGSSEGAATSFLMSIPDRLGEALTLLDNLDNKLDDAIKKDTAGKYKFLDELKAKLCILKNSATEAQTKIKELVSNTQGTVDALAKAITDAGLALRDLATQFTSFADEAIAKIKTITEEDVKGALTKGVDAVSGVSNELLRYVADLGVAADRMIERLVKRLRDAIGAVDTTLENIFHIIDEAGRETIDPLQEALKPQNVQDLLTKEVIKPAIKDLLAGANDETFSVIDEENLKELRALIAETSAYVERNFVNLNKNAVDEFSATAKKACEKIGGGLEDAYKFINNIETKLGEQITKFTGKLSGALGNLDKLKCLAEGFDHDVRTFSNGLAGAYSSANAYADRVLETVGNLDSGGIMAAPNNILRLFAAAASAPALPNLDFARERLGYYYKELNDIIDTTPAEAWFGRLGDELKAMGLSLPFRQIGDRLVPDDLSKFDISRVFKNFGGLKLDHLFKGYKLPPGAKDAIKLTHSFDKKQFRAWVQIDIDLPVPGRKSLFSVGPFQLDFVNSRMTGVMRLEASKDTDKVEQTGKARLGTSIEAVVAGQPMVMLREVGINYEKTSGLKVDFDPSNIKLNPSFQFIQDTLGTLFSDEIGGMKVIKQNGVPVGVEHEFSMPPVSLMGVTSGVSNIHVCNRFALIAYPDFVISDRFSLSKPEMPFLFSIFIIGGTGYITVDTEYRPFEEQLMVIVEAAAGGSAALGFAFGPVTGTVFITLSIALSYHKLIGTSGGGLTISQVLVIAGNVNVAGIVNVHINLLLRMSYRDNGQIDATGTLVIRIRISRFFKIKVRTQVRYKLRGGKSETYRSTILLATSTIDKWALAQTAARKLLEARG